MNREKRKLLFANTARAIGDAPREIQIRHIANCTKADPAYGKGVAAALGIDIAELSALSGDEILVSAPAR